MKKLLIERYFRILKVKDKLEPILGVKIENRGKEVYISGNSEDEYIAEKVITALDFGFPLKMALLIKEEDFLFVIVNIKAHTKRHDLNRIRARIIGSGGKTLRVLNELTKCFFEIKDNQIGIIGDSDSIENAEKAVVSLIQGSKQSNVYAYLEKHRVEPIFDYGIKSPKLKKKGKSGKKNKK